MTQILIATSNPHKLQEYTALLADLPFRFVGLHDVGISDEVEETGDTFEANARIKADAYSQRSGLITLADDSGLVIDALGGAPGVYSARYGGVTGAAQLALVLQQLGDHPLSERTARFVCVIALAVPGEPIQTVHGTVEGLIEFEPRGTHGFGYDPIFLVPERNRTMAELTADEKNCISHRGRAVQAVRPLLLALANR
jgi:XTP/dITP diphosphohydrolase